MELPAEMTRQTRTRGQNWPVDKEWKRRVLLAMDEQGISRTEMARRTGCTPGAITVLFRPVTGESKLVPAIHRELGWPPPTTTTASDEVLRRINAKWATLSKEQRDLVDNLVDQLTTAKH